MANPAAPQLLADVPLTGAGSGIDSRGHYASVACDWSGLQMFDVNVPTEPRRVGTYYPGASVLDVALHGNFAYLAVEEEPGLEVIDAADPQRPVPVGKDALPAATRIAVMSGSYACVTGDGLQVVDLGDAAHPVCVGQHQSGMRTFGLDVVGTLAYVAVGEYEMAVYRLTPQLILQPPVQDGADLRLSWARVLQPAFPARRPSDRPRA